MDKVYEFWYNECIYESAAQCMSLHRTQKGAEMAMEYHKNDIHKEYREVGCEPTSMAWGVREITIND